MSSHGMPLATQTMHENDLSTGQIGGLIIEMNDILHDEFYPALGSNKTRWFDTIWGAIQSLLCAEAISVAQNLVKTTCEPPITIQQSSTAQSYAAVTQSNLPSLPTPHVQPVSQSLAQDVQVFWQDCPDLVRDDLQDPAKVVSMLNQAITKFSDG